MKGRFQNISNTHQSSVARNEQSLALKQRNTINAAVIGVGFPRRSIGWLHLTQLLKMESVRIRHIVSETMVAQQEKGDAETLGGKEATMAYKVLKSSNENVSCHSSVNELPRLDTNGPCLVVIACRTLDAPTLFKAAVEKGATHIYLEEPGAPTINELREMIALADRSGVAVVIGYQKTIADYVKRAWEADREWRHDVVNLRFETHNPSRPEDLEGIFRANREGMLLNHCSHELHLWVTKWGLKPEDIVDVLVHHEDTQLERFGDIQDFSKLAFTARTNNGRNFTLVASRCGGIETSITVSRGLVGEQKVFMQASSELQKQAEQVLAESPNTSSYYPLFELDILKLKQNFIDWILIGKDGVPPDAPTLTEAALVLEMGNRLLAALLAQADRPLEPIDASIPLAYKTPKSGQQESHQLIFTTRDVICKTPTEQRLWYTPHLFDPDCSTLVDVLRPPQGRIIICIDDKVWSIYQDMIKSWAVAQGVELSPILVSNGEQAKCVENWLQVINNVWTVNPLRYSEPIIAMGGGAVIDTVGFVASVWRRSTPWVRIPTTLLGMVDASVGTKVSVNYILKNGIGAFHSPRHTFIDPIFLRTNEERQLKAAVGEMMKSGIIYDKRLYHLLRANGSHLIREKFLGANGLPSNPAKEAIFLSIKAMIDCVGPDFYEENLSREMDFGHTFSRSLECYEEFRLMHGEAVSIDCVFSTLIAEQKGWITGDEADDVLKTYKNMGLFIHVCGLTLDVYKMAIEQSTVHKSGFLRAPLPSPVGHCQWSSEITQDELTGAWQRLQAFLANYPEGILDPNSCIS